MPLPRWMRNDPIESTRLPTGGFQIDSDARRYNRRKFVNRADDVENDYSISINAGGFTGVSIPWGGTSPEDARDSFLEYLFNHDEFGLQPREPHKYFRSTYVNFNGSHMLLTFRTNWIMGFTVG